MRKRLKMLFITFIMVLIVVNLSGCSGKSAKQQADSVTGEQGAVQRSMKLAAYNDKRIGVVKGTDASIVTAALPNANILDIENIEDGKNALLGNQIDAIAYSKPLLSYASFNDKRFTVVTESIQTCAYGFGLKKGNSQLKSEIDNELDYIKGDGDTYHQMVMTWVKSGGDKQMPQIQQGSKGTLKMAAAPDIEPFSYKNENEYIGFEIELARRIAQRLDKRLEIVPVEKDQLYNAVKDGKADMCCGLLPITFGQDDATDFSNIVYEGGIALMVLK